MRSCQSHIRDHAVQRGRPFVQHGRAVHQFATMAGGIEPNVESVQAHKLTVSQTATRYWVVQSGAVGLAGALTREAAEAERELLRRLRDRSVRRALHPERASRDSLDATR